MSPEQQQRHIVHFLQQQQVLTLCAANGGDMWCANCFYLLNPATMALWLMTDPHTRHGQLMLNHHRVVGTIAPQPESIASIKGVQYQGEATLLLGEAAEQAANGYYQHFPQAKGRQAAIWQIDLHEIKMTDNSLGFGQKLYWQR